MLRLNFAASLSSFCSLINWKPCAFFFIFFWLLLLYLLSHVSCLNIHWELSACWSQINLQQQMRKWDFIAKDQIPLHGEMVTERDSTVRAKCHRSVKLMVWPATLLRLILFRFSHPIGVYTCLTGLLPSVGLGPETAAGYQWFPKKL